MTLQNYLKRVLPALDSEMRNAVDHFLPDPSGLNLMLRYHMGWAGVDGTPANEYSGKRIRPVLVLLCAENADGGWSDALPAAAAIELLHNFSLIHDDIQDDSPLRRGRPTVWKVWGKENAINAGDAMFSLAHMELLRLVERGIPHGRVVEAAQLFETACLTLTRGQYWDMAFEQRDRVSVDEYLKMISAKSAELIAVSTQLGAIVAGESEETRERYGAFGRSLGLAFQIRDDILGIWGASEAIGKSVATDIISRKKSLPVLYGLERSVELEMMYAKPYQGDDELERAVEILNFVGARVFAEQCEARYFDELFDILDSEVFGSYQATVLGSLVLFLSGRQV